MKYAPLSHLLRKDNIKTKNQLTAFYDSSWKYCPNTSRITGEYFIFFQGGIIDHGIHVTVPLAQPSEESEYNAACTSVMDLAHLRMLIHELLNKDPDIVSEEAPLIKLDIKSDVCMANNGKDTKHTRYISIKVYFVRNGEKCKMHKIDWFEGDLKWSDIETKNIGENELNTRMKYIMVRLDK